MPKHITSAMLRRLATRPSDLARYMATGALPRGIVPQSPLITLLKSITPRDRAQIHALVVSEALGYVGTRRFHNAAQALLWLAPSSEVFGSFPAETCRIRSFSKALSIQDLAEFAVIPEHILSRYS